MTQFFSLDVARLYAQELAVTLAREKMDEGARRAEIMDFAKLVMEVYRREKKDWSPASRGPAAETALNNNGGN